MKVTILKLLLGLGFISLMIKGVHKKEIKSDIPCSKYKEYLEKIDSVNNLNLKLNEETFKKLQCDNKILEIKKKDILQPHVSISNYTDHVFLEDSCFHFTYTLN